MTQLSQNFNSKEFRCRCCGVALVDHHLIYKLQHARDLYGKPMRITSGYRCQHHNQAVGGVKNSYHTQGKAADVVCPAEDWDEMMTAFREAGFERIGVYPSKGFIHVDVGESPSPAHWEG